ncbi:MAG: hypothetical protein E3J78_04380 [Candidatus Cloacimonadota bacterium]|nr:MAG: hypothetical protein E3J78_04380 [Candidatus Cloacimonadota bacterium]
MSKQLFCKVNHGIVLLTAIMLLTCFPFAEGKLFEELDPEYSISSMQAQFLPWWEDEWEEMTTGFRILGSSYDLHTLHILQHWKGRFPLHERFFISFNYFTDANVDSQFYEREIELKWRFHKRHHLSAFGYPYYDKKQSDIGIRYSYEETPIDFIRLSLTFENAPNNYSYKDRNEDSMRIYQQKPIKLAFDVSAIMKENHRFILSYAVMLPYRATYENKDGEILYGIKGNSSDIDIKHKIFFADSCVWGWGMHFLFIDNKHLSPEGFIESVEKRTRFKPYIFLDERSSSPLHLVARFSYDLEQNLTSTGESIERRSFLLGIKTNFWTKSKIIVSYCNGNTHYISEERKRRDNRIILTAVHKFKNSAHIGTNIGIDIDSRDTYRGYLGRYDKLFIFLQYPMR